MSLKSKDGECTVSSGFRKFVDDGLPAGSRQSAKIDRIIRTVKLLHVMDDFAGLCAAYAACWILRFGFDFDPLRILFVKVFVNAAAPVENVSRYAVIYAAWAPVYVAIGFAFLFTAYSLAGMYDGAHRMMRTPLLWNYLVCNTALLACVSMLEYFAGSVWHVRSFIPGVILLNIPFSYVFRRLTNASVKSVRRTKGGFLYSGLLVGSGRVADAFAERAEQRRLKGYAVTERIECDGSTARTIGMIDDALASRCAPLIAIVPDQSDEFLAEMLKVSIRHNSGLVIYSERFLALHNPFTYGDTMFGVPLVHFPMLAFHSGDGRLYSFFNRFLALLGIAALSPVLLAAAIAVKLDSPGPVLFVQERYGRSNRRFRMYKFRTMCMDAEAKLQELRDRNETDGALFKLRDDPRVTRVGKILRKTSIDELPQLFNILSGDMNIVGPRPLPCADVDPFLDSWQGLRHAVKPGLTCIWQVSGRSDIGFDSMALLDLWYACNRTWTLDLKIVLRTAWTVIFGHGAY